MILSLLLLLLPNAIRKWGISDPLEDDNLHWDLHFHTSFRDLGLISRSDGRQKYNLNSVQQNGRGEGGGANFTPHSRRILRELKTWLEATTYHHTVVLNLLLISSSQTMHYDDDLKVFHTVEIKEHFDAMAEPPRGYVPHRHLTASLNLNCISNHFRRAQSRTYDFLPCSDTYWLLLLCLAS